MPDKIAFDFFFQNCEKYPKLANKLKVKSFPKNDLLTVDLSKKTSEGCRFCKIELT